MRLWSGLRPGRPGQQLPANRDSTDYITLSTPGQQSGHELFEAVDVEGEWLYVAYNAGLSIWWLDDPEEPLRWHIRDGWLGDFLDFPGHGEGSTFVVDVDAIADSPGSVLVAVAGLSGVGPSIWRHTTGPHGLAQLYQDQGHGAWQIVAAEVAGKLYAFAAVGGDGIAVYDMTAAEALAETCLDFAGDACPGVYLGRVGGGGVETFNATFLDALELDGDAYVVAGRGNSQTVDLWRVDLEAPSQSELRFSGLPGGAHGVALVPHRGEVYLAAAERLPSHDREVRIYRLTAECFAMGSCAAIWTGWAVPQDAGGIAYPVTVSTSRGAPWLYAGLFLDGLQGTRAEGLFDLSTLGTTNEVVEITDGGGLYADDCAGVTVDYWGDYYPDNGHGLRNVVPKGGKFAGDYFYRAARGVLDVHVRREIGLSELIFKDGFEVGDTSTWR